MRLRDLRLEKGLLQKDIAKLLGVDRTTYAKYETEASEPSRDTLIKLAKIFEVSTDYLLEVADQRGKPPTGDNLNENSPSTDESAPGEELHREFIHLAGTLSEEQRDLFLAVLRLTAAKNQGLPVADLVSAGEAALKSELQNPTR